MPQNLNKNVNSFYRILFISPMQINGAVPGSVEDRDPGVIQRYDGKRFKCGDCNFATARFYNLKVHSRKHTGNLLQCQHCDYTTTRCDSLKDHTRKHTGEMLQCQHCDYTTIYSSALKRHSNKHTVTSK